MAFEWSYGYQPDEWIDDDWRDENGQYHDGGMRKEPLTVSDTDTDIPF